MRSGVRRADVLGRGFHNVTCLYGTEGFTDELWEAVKKVRRVRIAYDADDAGERAAQRDAERFQAHGIEVWRVKFPHGMDANEYACKVKPADKSLALLFNAAQWHGTGRGHARRPAAAVAACGNGNGRTERTSRCPSWTRNRSKPEWAGLQRRTIPAHLRRSPGIHSRALSFFSCFC